MIDIDKYKGHTPPPWNITVSAFKGKYILEEATNPTCANEVCANADLMQDAPLLFAEVKRLRNSEKVLKSIWSGYLSTEQIRFHYEKRLKEMIE